MENIKFFFPYLYNFCSKLSIHNECSDLKYIYKRKIINSLFRNLSPQQINKFIYNISKKYGDIYFDNGTKDENYNITIISKKYVLRIFSSHSTNYINDLYEMIGSISNNPSFLEEIYEFRKLNDHVFYYVSKKYQSITKDFIIKNYLRNQYYQNIYSALDNFKKIGYYHLDVSIDNSVWDGDTKTFRLIDYNMFKKINQVYINDHKIRNSFFNL